MIKAVIFDMDGVIIDSEPIYLDRLKRFMNNDKIYPKIEELYRFVGSSEKATWKMIQNIYGKVLDKNKFDINYERYFKDETIKYSEILNEGIEELLIYLKRNKYLVAIASSSPMDNIVEVLNECNIKKYFDLIISGEMFNESKPNPEIYLYCKDKLEVNNNECLVIEDSNYGLRAAIDAKMKVIAYKDTRFRFDQSVAHYEIDKIKEVINILKKDEFL